MKAVGEQCAGKPPALFDEGLLGNASDLLYYFGMPNRIAEGFLRLFGEKLGVSSEFSYKTIERGYDPGRSKKLLDEVLRIMNESGSRIRIS